MKVHGFAAVSALPLALACAATQPQVPGGAMGGIVMLPVKPSVFVRATFDTDPSGILGAFIPDDVDDGAIDETRAARTRCSEYIKPKRISAGGEVEEVFSATSSAGGGLGVDGIAKIMGERSQSNALRIKYSAGEKMIAQVDTTGLQQCCAAAPDQCSKRYISSVISGDGRIYVAREKADKAGLEGSGSVKGVPVSGDVMYKDGLKWERTTEFKAQFFAFSFQQTGVGKNVDNLDAQCTWAKRIPKSLDGTYFVGVSEPTASERTARDLAMREARSQVVKYLGEYIDQSSRTNQKLAGAIGAIGGEFQDSTTIDSLSQGIAKLVKDEAWCDPERSDTPEGRMNVVRVLAFFPNSERSTAARVQLTNLMEVLRAKGQLTPDREKALRAAITEIK